LPNQIHGLRQALPTPKEETMETLLIAGAFVAVYLLLQIVILPKMGIST
jgi:hypothetical protein